MKKIILLIVSALLLMNAAMAFSIAINPSVAYTNDNLQCSAGSNPSAYLYSWYEGSNHLKDGQNLEASYTSNGHTYTCKVYLPPTSDTSEQLLGEVSKAISNHAPTTPSLTLSGTGTYFANSVITATASGSTDADGDIVTYEYKFERGASALSSTNTLACAGTCAKGNSITVSARAYDGHEYSAWASKILTISNSAPTAPIIAYIPLAVYYNSTITANALSTDADGDTLTYAYQFEDANTSAVLQPWSATNTYALNYALVNQTIILRARAFDGTVMSGTTIINNIFVNDTGAAPASAPSYSYCSNDSSSSTISLVEITNANKIDGKKFKPLDSINIKVKVKNNDQDDKKVEIYAILVDNNSEVSDTETSKKITLNSDKTTTVILNMTLPSGIDEGQYSLYVKAYDYDNEDNCQQQSLNLQVKKSDHDVVFTDIDMMPTVFAGTTLAVSGKVANIGNDDEEKVKLTLTDDSGNVITDERDTLDSGDDTDFAFNPKIPENATAGMHTFTLTAEFNYNSDDESYEDDYSESYDFNVSMQAKQPVSVGVQEVQTQASESELSKWLDDNWMMAAIIAVEAIAIGFVVSTLKSRRA